MRKIFKIVSLYLVLTTCFMLPVDAKGKLPLPFFLAGLGVLAVNAPAFVAASTIAVAIGGASVALWNVLSGFRGNRRKSYMSKNYVIPRGMKTVRNALVQTQTIGAMVNAASGSILPGMMSTKRTEMIGKAVSRTLSNARVLSRDLRKMSMEMNGTNRVEKLKKQALSAFPGEKNSDIGILKSSAAKNTADNIRASKRFRKSLEGPSAKCTEVVDALVNVSEELKTLDSLAGSDRINYSRRLKAKLTYTDNMITRIEKDLSDMDSDLKKRYVAILLRARVLRDELSVSNSEMLSYAKNPGKSQNLSMLKDAGKPELDDESDLIKSRFGELTSVQKKYNEYQKKYKAFTSAVFHGNGDIKKLEKEYRLAFQQYLSSISEK